MGQELRELRPDGPEGEPAARHLCLRCAQPPRAGSEAVAVSTVLPSDCNAELHCVDCLDHACHLRCTTVTRHALGWTSIGWLISRHTILPPAGFEKPSAIQQKGIVPFGKGLDVIQQAQSGTGKTATFCAGVLQSLDFNLVECQALILAPTRELAQQIEKVMRALGDYLQVNALSCPALLWPAAAHWRLPVAVASFQSFSMFHCTLSDRLG